MHKMSALLTPTEKKDKRIVPLNQILPPSTAKKVKKIYIKNRIYEARRHMDEVFKAFDQRGDCTIDLTDLGNVFRCLKVNLTQADVYEIEAQLVKEPNQSVKFEYLILAYLQLFKKKSGAQG
uniref:EF-hand domain-containing protein n=1 Tax=Ditylenchus dipsaci TaxID=166011 RepID=A0A915E4M8_9BILA